jgi:dihydrodipicolinate synthase/N-acetylneuraminate lyase
MLCSCVAIPADSADSAERGNHPTAGFRIKYWLWRVGLIDSPEVRLPMTRVSDALAVRIDQVIAQTQSLEPV